MLALRPFDRLYARRMGRRRARLQCFPFSFMLVRPISWKWSSQNISLFGVTPRFTGADATKFPRDWLEIPNTSVLFDPTKKKKKKM